MNQNDFAFARKMVPCDYDSKLANVLPEIDRVEIKAYNGGKKKARRKEEELTK